MVEQPGRARWGDPIEIFYFPGGGGNSGRGVPGPSGYLFERWEECQRRRGWGTTVDPALNWVQRVVLWMAHLNLQGIGHPNDLVGKGSNVIRWRRGVRLSKGEGWVRVSLK